MRTLVHFDFRGQVRLFERLFHNVLIIGRSRIALVAIAMRNCALLCVLTRRARCIEPET